MKGHLYEKTAASAKAAVWDDVPTLMDDVHDAIKDCSALRADIQRFVRWAKVFASTPLLTAALARHFVPNAVDAVARGYDVYYYIAHPNYDYAGSYAA